MTSYWSCRGCPLSPPVNQVPGVPVGNRGLGLATMLEETMRPEVSGQFQLLPRYVGLAGAFQWKANGLRWS